MRLSFRSVYVCFSALACFVLWAPGIHASGGADSYRLSPSADVRVTSNIRLGFSMRDVYTTVDSRTYLFELQVKTQ